ncbi:unnamed protein product [Diamesa serratosioi]
MALHSENRKFCFEHNTPVDFVSSQWQSERKCFNFLVYRWILAVFFVGTVILSIFTALENDQFDYYFIYLTNLGIWLCMISTLLGAVLVTVHHYDLIAPCYHEKMTKIFKFYWFLSNATSVLAFCISITYWSLVFDGRDWGINDFLTHAGNSIVLFADLFVVRHPGKFTHFIYPPGVGLIYLLFTLVYTFLGGKDRYGENYVYKILDWRHHTKSAAIISAITIVLLCVIHLVVVGIHRVRCKIHNHQINKRNLTMNVSSTEIIQQDV